jgi:SAM-dependent methyltransferase
VARGPVAGRPAPDGPNWARMSNYWLGGHDYAVTDQEQAARVEKVLPMARDLAASNRMFVSRAVGWAAAGREEDGRFVPGVDQFVDAGCGFPPASRTHEIAAAVHRSPSVVYVDWDPEVLDNLEALRGRGESARFAAVPGDLRDPAAVLRAAAVAGPADLSQPRLIDLRRPVCLLLTAVLHAMPPGQAREITAGYARLLAPGSYIAISVLRVDDQAMWRDLAGSVPGLELHDFTRGEFEGLFGGLELVEPGIAPVLYLRPGWKSAPAGTPGPAYMVGGIGRKP